MFIIRRAYIIYTYVNVIYINIYISVHLYLLTMKNF